MDRLPHGLGCFLEGAAPLRTAARIECDSVWGAAMCSGSEADSYLRLIDFVYHSTRGLRVKKKKKDCGVGDSLYMFIFAEKA